MNITKLINGPVMIALRKILSLPRNILNRIELLSDERFAYLMLLPALLLVSFMAFWPIFDTLRMSMHADTEFGGGLVGEFAGADNYINIITGDALLASPFIDMNQPFQSSLPLTIIITIFSVTFVTILGFILALFVNENFKGRAVMRTIIILPWAVPVVIQGIMFYLLFTPGVGPGPRILSALNLSMAGAPIASNQGAALVIVIAEVWKHSAFVAILILAGLQSIDREYYKVAKVAGASKWQTFKRITFPLILPVLLIVMTFRTIGSLRIYGIVVSISRCDQTPVMACSVIQEFSLGRYGSASALAIILAALVGTVVVTYLVKLRDTV